jgi:hypothetical protein
MNVVRRAMRVGGVWAFVILSASPGTMLAQATVATVSVMQADVRAGRSGECAIQVIPLASFPEQDTVQVVVNVVTDFTAMTGALNPVELALNIDDDELGRIPITDSTRTFKTTVRDLRGSPISLVLADTRQRICSVTTTQGLSSFLERGTSRTSFIIDGAVGAGLRSGASDGARVSGALGLVHSDTANKRHTPWLMRWLIPGTMASGERLKAVVTVASSEETLTDSVRTAFAHAIVSPSTAAGRAGSGLIDYYMYADRKSGMGTQGPRILFFISRSRWHYEPARKDGTTIIPNDTARTADVAIVAFEPRYRWGFIDFPEDPRGNSFSFGVELGAGFRWLSGDGVADSAFMEATLGTTSTRFYALLGSFWVQLRSVTASVDAPYFFPGAKESAKYPYRLRGLQPLIEIRFESPFFTF